MEKELFANLGLSNEEADIYASLLTNGAQTASGLASTTHVKRTYVYNIVKSLIKKNLASEEKKERTTYFAARSPEGLLSLIQAQREKTLASERELESILPSLKDKYLITYNLSFVRIYEGFEGVKQIYEDTLKDTKLIYVVLQTSSIDPKLRDWLKSSYLPKRARLGIKTRVILSSGREEIKKRNQDKHREVLEVPETKFPFASEINIYGNKVAFISYNKDQKLRGVVISEQGIVNTLKELFHLIWNNS